MTKITSTCLFLSHHHTESFMIASLLFHNNADLLHISMHIAETLVSHCAMVYYVQHEFQKYHRQQIV